MSTVKQNAVHPGIEEWLAFPPALNIDQDVEEGEEEEGEAGGDEDEGDAPEVLVEWYPAPFLTSPTQQSSKGPRGQGPAAPANQAGFGFRVNLRGREAGVVE